MVRKVTRYIILKPGFTLGGVHLESALVYAEARDLRLKGLVGNSELCGRATRA